jgi:predicted ATPase
MYQPPILHYRNSSYYIIAYESLMRTLPPCSKRNSVAIGAADVILNTSMYAAPSPNASILKDLAKYNRVCVIIEDVHHMDRNSWSLLLRCTESIPNILCFITTRLDTPEMEKEGNFVALMEAGAEVLNLSPFSRDEAVSLICEILNVDSVDENAVNDIWHKSYGNPMFAEQLTKAMMNDGSTFIINEVEGTMQYNVKYIGLPTSIANLLEKRIDSLSTSNAECLRVAR